MSFRAPIGPFCGMSVFASNRPMCWESLVRPGRANPHWRARLSGCYRLPQARFGSMVPMSRQWPRESLGRHIGYLPQDIELFADTVASNISRFRNDDDQEVIEAAQMAGVHDMILRLPGGYETQIGEGGAVLSGGYRQRIGLARAVYDNPSLVVLDEPSSNLDSDGDTALLSCIAELKKRGTTVVMISHRPNTLGAVDKLLLLRDGAVEMFGPRDEIIGRLSRPAAGQSVTAKTNVG